MKILIGFDGKFTVAFLAFCVAVVCTAPLSADEPRRAFGGLFDAARASEKRISDEQEILDKQQKARQSIDKTVVVIKDEYAEFHKRVLQGDKVVQDAVREVKKALPEELQAAAARVFDRPSFETPSVLPAAEPSAEMPVAEGRLAENAVSPLQLPKAVKKYEKIWEDVCQYHAADSRLHEEMQKLLKKAEKADELTTQDEETANKLVTLANELVEVYSRLRREQWLVEAKRKVHGIDAVARRYGKDTVEKIKGAVENHQRKLDEQRKAEESEAEKKAAAEKFTATIEEEQKTAEEAFANLEDAIKRIDWMDCTNTLIRLQGKMATREGKDAVNDQIRKIDVMAGMQRHFIKHAKGFKFTDSSMVTDVDGTELTIKKVKLDGKRRPVVGKDRKPVTELVRIQWRNFYAQQGPGGKPDPDYPGYMFQLMNAFVRNGRKRTGIGPKEWSEYMLGAAFTLKYFYGDQKVVVEKIIPMFVQEAVKGFEPSRKWAAKWFPDVKLEDSDE